MTALFDRLPREALGNRLARYGFVAARCALGLVFALAGASMPEAIPLRLILTALWFALAYQHRATLTQLLK